MVANIGSYESSGRWLAFFERYGPPSLCVVTGFLSGFTISLGGQMPVGELILLVVLPWVLVRAYFRRSWPTRLQQLGWYRLLLLLAGVTALGYIASDLYRDTPFDNLIRGWARVGFLVIDLVAIGYLIDTSWNRLQLFIFSLYIGGTANALIGGPLHGEWWKFGFGYLTTTFVLFIFAGRNLALQVVIAAAMGLLNLGLGARSLGAICLLIAGLMGLHYARGIWRPIALFASLGATVGLLFAANAVFLENQEHSGSDIERQSMVETAAEIFVTSPLVGQGSWFTSTEMISQLERNRRAKDVSFRGYSEAQARALSIHSQLLASLAEGGIMGGAFFLGLGFLIFKTLRTLMRHAVPRRAFVFYLVLAGGWNLLMTPFSGVTRIEIALLACVCLLVILQRQGELTEDYRE